MQIMLVFNRSSALANPGRIRHLDPGTSLIAYSSHQQCKSIVIMITTTTREDDRKAQEALGGFFIIII